jgi:polyhydroxybutyrate depolymerase
VPGQQCPLTAERLRWRPGRLSRFAGVAALVALGALAGGCGGAPVRPLRAQTRIPATAGSPSRPGPAVRPSRRAVPSPGVPSPGVPGPGVPGPPGCRLNQPLPGVHAQTLPVGGLLRSYLLEVPDTAHPGLLLPLILSFHGYAQSDYQQNAYTGLAGTAQTHGVYVVTPQGYGGRWNFPRRAAVGPSDVTFVQALLSALQAQICFDPRRVVVAGMSDGADMANTLGCALPGRVAAVFAVAPSVFPQPCPTMPPTVVEVHGTADPIVPFDGGGGDRPFPFQGLTAQPVATRMASWAALGRCAAPAAHPVAAGVSAEVWSCPKPLQLALYVIAGGGHTWPGAAPWPALGATTDAVSADDAVLALAQDPSRLPW